jgi:predicted nucleotidyltransferase
VKPSRAERLLTAAEHEPDRSRRHLLVAAALRATLRVEPVIVGGTAEEFHAGSPYHETDLDVCGWLHPDEPATLRRLGFRRRGRHWFHDGSKVAVEFPEARIDGDEARIERIRIGGGTFAVIGVDDLYLDRLRQATAPMREESIEFHSALAVAAGAFDRIDRRYVLRRIREIERDDPSLGRRMRTIDVRIRRRVARARR